MTYMISNRSVTYWWRQSHSRSVVRQNWSTAGMATGNKHSVNDVKFGRRDFLWVCRPERRQANALTGWPQSRRKNISCAFQSHTLTFPLQQKVNTIMTFIKGIPHQLQQCNSSPPHSWLCQKFTRLCSFEAQDAGWKNPKYLQIFQRQTKTTLFVTIFPRGCTELPEFSMFWEIPEYSRFVATLIN